MANRSRAHLGHDPNGVWLGITGRPAFARAIALAGIASGWVTLPRSKLRTARNLDFTSAEHAVEGQLRRSGAVAIRRALKAHDAAGDEDVEKTDPSKVHGIAVRLPVLRRRKR